MTAITSPKARNAILGVLLVVSGFAAGQLFASFVRAHRPDSSEGEVYRHVPLGSPERDNERHDDTSNGGSRSLATPPLEEPERAGTSDPAAAKLDALDNSEFASVGEFQQDPHYNPLGKSLTTSERDRLESMLADFNRDIADLRQNVLSPAINRHVDAMIEAGFYEVTKPGEAIRSQSSRLALGFRGDGKQTKVVQYDPATVPEIQAARDTLNEVREALRDQVRDFFASIPPK